MKVFAINGSPKPDGNTARALQSLLQEVADEGFATELATIGNQAIRGCIGCMRCAEAKSGRCEAFDDPVNEFLPEMTGADAIVLGSPVYFSGINGTLKSFLDRAFFVSWVNGGLFRLKAGAAVVALRRCGASAALGQLDKYFQISEITTIGSCYWSAVHGFAPGELEQDAEGMQIVRTLGRNLAWYLKLVRQAGTQVGLPKREDPVMTNFVR